MQGDAVRTKLLVCLAASSPVGLQTALGVAPNHRPHVLLIRPIFLPCLPLTLSYWVEIIQAQAATVCQMCGHNRQISLAAASTNRRPCFSRVGSLLSIPVFFRLLRDSLFVAERKFESTFGRSRKLAAFEI